MPMQMEHVGEVVDIHLKSFPGFFLTFLGPRFLRLLYTEIIQYPEHVAYVACASGKRLVGFVAGIKDESKFYRHLVRTRLFHFMSAALGSTLQRPLSVFRLLRALTYPSQKQEPIAQAVLMSIAVHPEASRRGVGQKLVKHFLEEINRQEVKSVSLTTDADNNESVNQFYQKLGFEIMRTYVTPEGRRMYEYLIRL